MIGASHVLAFLVLLGTCLFTWAVHDDGDDWEPYLGGIIVGIMAILAILTLL